MSSSITIMILIISGIAISIAMSSIIAISIAIEYKEKNKLCMVIHLVGNISFWNPYAYIGRVLTRGDRGFKSRCY